MVKLLTEKKKGLEGLEIPVVEGKPVGG